ncbi:dihydropteroate synthase [Desulfocurvus sp.]|uniref:dihydropteroate synthase n=1 Tax=Desulfocurvus sp. TaxID=2871698 RepID=UPI0025B95094|nr:dihydropteroate synthase [Desulfocurvus sp.]MCK9239879.1 dihydropteroate synthase [Desulfocurvus sp.]
MQERIFWNVTGGRVLGPAPFFVVGIVNATPDSFYDGGRHDAPEAAVAHGRRLLAEGAAVLDVGGESTRPGAEAVCAEREMDRVLPVVRGLAGHIGHGQPPDAAPRAVISVDTFKARVAAAALDAGAAVVNDISACRFDPGLLDVVGQYKPGYVLMHSLGRPGTMQRDPRYADVVHDIVAFFEERLRALTGAGLPEENIVIDPGIGFGKTLEHNLDILRNIEAFGVLGLPLYVGLSNKSMFQQLLGLPVAGRGGATQAAVAVLASRGVRIHRVHDVAATVQTLTVAEALRARRPGPKAPEAPSRD